MVLFSLLIFNAAYAEDLNTTEAAVEDSFDDIQILIDNAKSGDSIYLENKTYSGNGNAIKIKKDITIYGSDAQTVLDASGKSCAFTVSRNANVSIVGLTIANGFSQGKGGAILNYGKLTLINSTIMNCNAERGAIHCSDRSYLTVYNSLFDGNTAVSGAAIENDNANGIVNVFNTTFTNNLCEEGGAIYNIWGEFNIYNSTFYSNTAQRGGAVYNNRGILKVYNTYVVSNVCDDLGAGIKSWGICEVYDSVIVNNTNTKKQGGGFYVSEFSLKIQNCLVENNTAVWGGGVYVEAKANLNVINSTISNNFAERGGGIDLNQGSLTLTDSNVSNNIAEGEGGAIRCSFLASTIRNSQIENNVAKAGGGIYVDGVSVDILNSSLVNNSASDGGAVYNTGILTLSDFKMNANSAAVNGGAIHNLNNVLIDNGVSNKNKASSYGGAIYNKAALEINKMNATSNEAYFGGVVYTDKFIKVNNSIFTSNKASEAGAIYSSANLTVSDSQFTNNQISRKGGALAVSGEDVRILNSVFIKNTGADEGGCIFSYGAHIYVNSSSFISNSAKSYGAAIDNSGELTVENSLFDNNKAYGAGAIDNGGKLNIINSTFTNNRATINGGAIDNKGNMTVFGSVFTNNVALGDGGAMILRRNSVISHSIIFSNTDSNGYDIFNSTWDEVSLANNWWGSNNPDFGKILNFNISDDFTWIIMNFTNSSKLIQGKNAEIIVSFNEITNSNHVISKLENLELLPVFEVKLSSGDILSVRNGIIFESIPIPATPTLTAQMNDESLTLNAALNPDDIKRIVGNKNVVVDYDGKATFKVCVVGDDGNFVGKGITITMKVGKVTYNVTTDKNGYATKTFSFKPGKYSVLTSYRGYGVKNTLTIKKVLNANSATKKLAKKIKYSASLKKSNGKAISNKKITFKIKGKTYSAKTNKKGVATASFKNLKVGKYSVVVKYLKSQVKTTLKVKK